jgi:hypothetical protein
MTVATCSCTQFDTYPISHHTLSNALLMQAAEAQDHNQELYSKRSQDVDTIRSATTTTAL